MIKYLGRTTSVAVLMLTQLGAANAHDGVRVCRDDDGDRIPCRIYRVCRDADGDRVPCGQRYYYSRPTYDYGNRPYYGQYSRPGVSIGVGPYGFYGRGW